MYPACSSCEPWEKFSRATSMPSSSKARIPASLFEDGPSVQMIFARRGGAISGEHRKEPDRFSLMIVSWLRYCTASGLGSGGRLAEGQDYGLAVTPNSLPSSDRGNSMALNSAPMRMTSEIRYIHTSSAMATPRDP